MRGTRVRNHPPVVPMLVSISTQANAMTLVWEVHAAEKRLPALSLLLVGPSPCQRRNRQLEKAPQHKHQKQTGWE